MADFSLHLSGAPALILTVALGYVLIYLPLKLITSLLAHIKFRIASKYKLEKELIIAEYEPPEGLTAAEIGFMYDTKLNDSEIFATIISLEQQGLIEITRENNGLIIKNIKMSGKEQSDFESWLLGYLESFGGKKLTKRMMRSAARNGSNILNNQLQKNGYFIPVMQQIQKVVIRILTILALLIGLTVVLFLPHNLNEAMGIFLGLILVSPGYIFISLFLYIKFQKIVGAEWIGTPKLKAIWPDIEGYRQYIKMVELDNLSFESENTKTMIKNKAHPYAIALGFNTGWRNQL